MRMRITRALIAVGVSTVLAGSFVASCGGDDGDDNGSDDTGSGASTTVVPIELDGRIFLSHTVTVDGRDRPLVAGTRITLTFDDGTVGVSAGCNSMSGDYTFEGEVMSVGDLATTEMGCDPERHEQDEWLADVLTSSPSVRLSEPELTLTSDDTVIALVDREVAEPDLELTGGPWVLESIIDDDVVGSVPAGVEATFEISGDGVFLVQLGCNSGGGTAETADGKLIFDEMARTTMACGDAAMQVEEAVAEVLTGEVAYEIDADRLSMRKGQKGLDWRSGV